MLTIAWLVCVLMGVQPSSKEAPPKTPQVESRGELSQREWLIDGVKRVAMVWTPSATIEGPRPVIFAFHGHGGSAKNAPKSFGYHNIWPEAICVYMEGLPTKGITDPDGKRNGWQKMEGEYEDRDLKFFDTVLESLKKEGRVDDSRVYVTGHSNGGGFTYLLWAKRGEVFAAVAPSAGGGMRLSKELKPLPAFHVAGKQDKLVPYSIQSSMMARVRKLNSCEGEGTLRADGCREFKSAKGTPCVEYVYDGGHNFPDEAPALIVKFFKEHARKAPPATEPKQ